MTLRAIHTPGHTPEHLSFLVTDGATTDEPGFVLTGDFVFVGTWVGRICSTRPPVGRTRAFERQADVREPAQQVPRPARLRAGLAWARGGGACGKALGAVPSSTVGYERLFSWWGRYVERNDEEGFVEALLEGSRTPPSTSAA